MGIVVLSASQVKFHFAFRVSDPTTFSGSRHLAEFAPPADLAGVPVGQEDLVTALEDDLCLS